MEPLGPVIRVRPFSWLFMYKLVILVLVLLVPLFGWWSCGRLSRSPSIVDEYLVFIFLHTSYFSLQDVTSLVNELLGL